MSAPPVDTFLLRHPDVEFVQLNYVTLSGTVSGLCIPASRCRAIANAQSPIKIGPFAMVGLCPWQSLSGKATSGCENLYPDWKSLRYLCGNEASVLCDVSEESTGHLDVDPGHPFLRCPRRTLQNVLERATLQHHLSFLCGFELEFYLVEPHVVKDLASVVAPAHHLDKHLSTYRGERGDCLRECVKALLKAEIEIEAFHSCSAPMQYEVSLSPLPVLAAADTVIQAMEIIRRTSVGCGFKAIFIPKPFETLETSGLHMHLSITGILSRLTGAHPVSTPVADSFLAGTLRRLTPLAAIGMPCEMSYHRVREPISGGSWVAWGHENKDAPIRAISKTHWEFRPIDATANLYLVAAGYIAAGLVGIEQQEALTLSNTTAMLATLDEGDREKLGIDTRMPQTFRKALESLEGSCFVKDMRDLLGSQIVPTYCEHKRGEAAALAAMSPEARNLLYMELF